MYDEKILFKNCCSFNKKMITIQAVLHKLHFVDIKLNLNISIYKLQQLHYK